MHKTSSVQFRAVLLVLLLVGCEARRVVDEIDMREVLRPSGEQAGASNVRTVFGELGPHAVCQAGLMTDPGKAVERYLDKCAKITSLSGEILAENCLLSCPLKLRKVKEYVKSFKSCIDMREGSEAGSIPPELNVEMAGSTSHSIPATLTKVQGDLISMLKKAGHFGANGACEFNVQDVNVQEAFASTGDSMDTVRRQLFGKGCASEEAIRTYMDGFSKSDREMVTKYLNTVSDLLKIHQRAKERGESWEQEGAELERAVDEDASSLLALEDTISDNSTALDAAGTGWVVIFIVCWVLLLLLVVKMKSEGY